MALSWRWVILLFVVGAQCSEVMHRQTPLNETAVSATTRSEPSRPPHSKVRIQTSVSGFESQTTLEGGLAATDSPSSVIEDHASSFSATPGPPVSPPIPLETTQNTPTRGPQEASEPRTTLGADAPIPVGVITHASRTLTPVPESTLIIDSQTLTAGTTITMRDTGVQIHLLNGTPIIALDGRTSTVRSITPAPTMFGGYTLSIRGLPVTSGSGPSVTTYTIDNDGSTLAIVNGKTATLAAPLSQTVFFGGDITAVVSASRYQYLVHGSTLQLGASPLTLDGTILSLSTNLAAHKTVLAIGASTTALEPPTPLVDFEEGVKFTVVDGTTKYVIGGKTLGPGDVGFSVDVKGGSTVLVVGGRSTTVSAPGATGTVGGKGAKGNEEKNGGVKRKAEEGRWMVGLGCWLALVLQVR